MATPGRVDSQSAARSPESRYASQKIHKAMTTMNATANTGSVNSVHASTSPWTARNKTIDRINANTHTIAPTRATRWLSSSERRSSRSVCRLSHTPGFDDSNRFHASMTLRRLSAFSSSRSYPRSVSPCRAIGGLLLRVSISRSFKTPCAGLTCRTRAPTWGRRWAVSCVDARVRYARCHSLAPNVVSVPIRPRSDQG